MGAFYTGLSYPAEYHGNLFFADFVRGFIRRLAYDPNTLAWNAVSPDFATGPSGIIGLESGPQGDLYYLLFNTDRQRRQRAAPHPLRARDQPAPCRRRRRHPAQWSRFHLHLLVRRVL